MNSDLSILCVTRAEPHSIPFLHHLARSAEECWAELVIVADGNEAYERLKPGFTSFLQLTHSRGFIESCLDEALSHCHRRYVLRIDDDERISGAMGQWLVDGRYRDRPHWKFPRAHVWGRDGDHYILNYPLWRDHQTRLSVREMAGGRTTIHCGSPHGGGDEAPVQLLHYKFVVKTLDERRAIIVRYETVQEGAGVNLRVFSCPEDALADVNVGPIGFGEVRDPLPEEIITVSAKNALERVAAA